jgi:hypothetical protein
MLISLLFAKPLIYQVTRKVFGVDNPAVIDRLDRAWRHEGYRQQVRRCTAVAGVVLLFMVAIQVGGAFTLPIGVALPVLNVTQLVLAGALVVGIRTVLRRSMRGYAEVAA